MPADFDIVEAGRCTPQQPGFNTGRDVPATPSQIMNQALFDKYYPKDRFEGGTIPFFRLCLAEISPGASILEIGAGPTNEFSELLSRTGTLTGIDVDPDVRENRWLSEAIVFDGQKMPLPDAAFDACCSNFVLEHVERPEIHFREVARILKPGGIYCFRTMNLHHYVCLGAKLLPHFMHLKLANRLRGLDESAHDPYPTFYRANTIAKVQKLCAEAELNPPVIQMVEPEPAYGRAHALLFYPMMVYERIVNRFAFLAPLRITMLVTIRKP
jgi:SAM-dependent methyltransferase